MRQRPRVERWRGAARPGPRVSCSHVRLPRDGSVRPEQLDLPIGAVPPASAPPVDPPAPAVDPARALRSLAERFLEHARSKIETLQSVRAPEWLEADLSACETFIRE